MKKLFFILFSFIVIKSIAQPYQNALGVRIGYGVGLTFKSFINSNAAIEGMATYPLDGRGITVTALYEIHNYKALKAANLALVYGFGAHVGYYNRGYYKNRSGIYYTNNATAFGIDGIIGLDYFIVGTPINWGIDVKPIFDFYNPGFRFWDGAVSIRYVLN